MKGTKTLTIIKPGAIKKEYTGPILEKINTEGFHISAMRLVQLTRTQAENFYAVHRGRPYYEGLIKFMTSGPVVVAILEKENAVDDYRKLIGSTDPAQAEEGTIRRLYADSAQSNAVHGSDNDENASMECNFFFSTCERFSNFE